jgi:hyperosmotically inducible protein
MYRKSKNLIASIGLVLFLNMLSVSYAAQTTTQSLIDVRQEVQIWTTYVLNPHLRAHDIKVSVKEGKATLIGHVPEDISKELAKEIALGVAGIKEVDNQIKVTSDPTTSQVNQMSGFAEIVDDATITATVKSKLLWSRNTDGLKMTVITKSGQVSLTGTADSAAAKELAGRLALNTRGVLSVNNALVISQDQTSRLDITKSKVNAAVVVAEQSISDSWITTKVKSTLLYSSNVSGTNIEVSTKAGVVTLSGRLSSGAEKALAVEVTENVRGVKSVEAKGLTF